MWSSAYPLGAYGLAATQFATDFDSPAFKVVSTIVLIVLVIWWLYLIVCTIPMIISGELLLAEAYEEMKKHREKHNEPERNGDGGAEDEEEQSGRARGRERRSRSSDGETAVSEV